jgi:hypothetical protein
MHEIPVKHGSFLAITREERFFCSLLVHALLSSVALRKEVFGLLGERAAVELDPKGGATEIYSEVAWLRDHWRNLGDPKKHTPEMDGHRWEVIEQLLKALGVEPMTIHDQPFLRTLGKHPKIVSPGRWPLKSLATHRQAQCLMELKWAFNAIPDFLLICRGQALLLEAKMESKTGKTSFVVPTPTDEEPGATKVFTYDQEKTQQTLRALLPVVAPYLDSVEFAWLARDDFKSDSPRLEWSEVAKAVEQLDGGDLDKFTRDGLLKFARRSARQN